MRVDGLEIRFLFWVRCLFWGFRCLDCVFRMLPLLATKGRGGPSQVLKTIQKVVSLMPAVLGNGKPYTC